jgi:hypothetical protein
MKRSLLVVVTSGVVLALALSPASAWQCPVQWKAAEEAIKKAEALNLTPEAKGLIADAKKLVAESKKHHNEATTKIEHAHSMWKARAALAQAEAAAVISQP